MMTKDDFNLFEDDKPQTIQYFSRETDLASAWAGAPQQENLRLSFGRSGGCVAHVQSRYPELDPAFTDRVILLADRADGHPLDNKKGFTLSSRERNAWRAGCAK